MRKPTNEAAQNEKATGTNTEPLNGSCAQASTKPEGTRQTHKGKENKTQRPKPCLCEEDTKVAAAAPTPTQHGGRIPGGLREGPRQGGKRRGCRQPRSHMYSSTEWGSAHRVRASYGEANPDLRDRRVDYLCNVLCHMTQKPARQMGLGQGNPLVGVECVFPVRSGS